MLAFSWVEAGRHLIDLSIAFGLALPIAWDRERAERSAGIRTFPLVAMSCCGFVLVGISVLGTASVGHARVLEGLITGMGFIGGGAILKQSDRTSGTATAASLWGTGVIGAAVGYGLYDIALILAIAMLITLRCMPIFKQPSRDGKQSGQHGVSR